MYRSLRALIPAALAMAAALGSTALLHQSLCHLKAAGCTNHIRVVTHAGW